MSAVEVLLERAGFLVVAKPAGVPVIPGRGGEAGDSLREQLEASLGAKLWVVHRLDRDTSGALVFARTPEAHRTLSMAFEEGRVTKRYLALVEGDLQQPQRVELALTAARKGKMRPVFPGEAGKASCTEFQPVERFGRATLVEARPLTGRTHQIRVHLKAIGHPLVFDHQYGQSEPLLGLMRTPLHASSVGWPALDGVEACTVDAPVPEDLERAMRLLR